MVKLLNISKLQCDLAGLQPLGRTLDLAWCLHIINFMIARKCKLWIYLQIRQTLLFSWKNLKLFCASNLNATPDLLPPLCLCLFKNLQNVPDLIDSSSFYSPKPHKPFATATASSWPYSVEIHTRGSQVHEWILEKTVSLLLNIIKSTWICAEELLPCIISGGKCGGRCVKLK